MPNPSDWTIEQTRALRTMTGMDAEELMEMYDLSEEGRESLRELVGWREGGEGNKKMKMKEIKKVKAGMDEIAKANLPPSNPLKASPSRPLTDPHRPLWLASAWLLGASHSALARLHSISPQAIQQSVRKLLPSAIDRHTKRIGYDLSEDSLRSAHTIYYNDLSHASDLSSPLLVSCWLQSLLSEDESDD